MKPNTLKSLLVLLLLTCTTAIIAFLIGGCGGSSFQPVQESTGWKQVDATYVGRIRCRDCHASIDDEYAQQDMGDNAETPMKGANCQACHVTGYGKPGGFDPANPDPKLDGIGCENCHGPGSKHVAASTTEERKANITRTPPAEQACWGCHGDRLKHADGTYGPGGITQPNPIINDATLHDVAPKSVPVPHHAAAAFLLGRGIYGENDTMPSPHSTMENTCMNCHKPGISPTTGHVNHGLDALIPPNLDTNRQPCASCHSGRYDDTPVQLGIMKKLIELVGADPNDPEEPDDHATGGMLAEFVTAHNIDTQTNAAPDDPYVIAYKAAKYEAVYVLREGSFGVHNPGAATRMLNDAYEKLSQ